MFVKFNLEENKQGKCVLPQKSSLAKPNNKECGTQLPTIQALTN